MTSTNRKTSGRLLKKFTQLTGSWRTKSGQRFPNQAMDKCTCIWEADSIENLQKYLREKVGGSSTESCYQVNEAAALGLGT